MFDEEENASGLIHGEKDCDYHNQNVFNGGKYLSSHSLGTFIDCPELYRQKIVMAQPETVAAHYKVGRAAHTMILEGRDKFNADYDCGGNAPINPAKGKPYGATSQKYLEWKAAQEASGLIILTAGEDSKCEMMLQGVTNNTMAAEVLDAEDGKPEVVARATYCGMPCQIRIDWLAGNAIFDLKTCADITKFEFDAKKYGYFRQASFYQKVYEQVTGYRVDFAFIAVEKQAPFRCGVWTIQQELLDMAQHENEAAIAELRTCLDSGNYPTRFDEVREFCVVN